MKLRARRARVSRPGWKEPGRAFCGSQKDRASLSHLSHLVLILQQGRPVAGGGSTGVIRCLARFYPSENPG